MARKPKLKVAPLPTTGTQDQKDYRINQLKIMRDNARANEKMLDELWRDTRNFLTKTEKLKLAQLPRIEDKTEENIDDFREDYTEQLDSDFGEQYDASSENKEQFLIKKTIVTTTIITSLMRVFRGAKNESIVNTFSAEVADLTLSQRIWKLGNDTKQKMMDRIALGALKGESSFVVSRDLRKYLVDPEGGGALYNTNRLARNELKNYANKVNFEQYKITREETGLSIAQVYQSALSATTREEHAAQHNKIILDGFHNDKETKYITSQDYISRSEADRFRNEINCLCYELDIVLPIE